MVLTIFAARLSKLLLFLTALVALYTALFFAFNQLDFPPIWDEIRFWQASLLFSQHPIPNLAQLQNYTELNTPLPFIVFGWLENLFHQGAKSGRLLNLILSSVLVFLIGAPLDRKPGYGILSAIGLLLCPYYLWLSAHLYTDIIATFFAFFGVWFYLRDRHWLSSVAFILAIASRQFMLAFPVAIFFYEAIVSFRKGVRFRWYWLPPILAASSIFGWILLFDGLAPSPAISQEFVPSVQKSFWAVTPSSSLYFLACLGLYFVIPEWGLFSRRFQFKSLLNFKNLSIAIGLLLLLVCFPVQEAHGILDKASNILPNWANQFLIYTLALLACIRFSQFNLAFCLVLLNTLLMLKAYPLDRYTLTLLVVFWYFKSIYLLDKMPEETIQPQSPKPSVPTLS